MFNATSSDAAPDWLFPVDLDTSEDELFRLLGLTHRAQNRMLDEGTDCPIRWNPATSCLACPLSEADNLGAGKKCQLCRTSTQEEHLETVLAAKQSGQ